MLSYNRSYSKSSFTSDDILEYLRRAQEIKPDHKPVMKLIAEIENQKEKKVSKE